MWVEGGIGSGTQKEATYGPVAGGKFGPGHGGSEGTGVALQSSSGGASDLGRTLGLLTSGVLDDVLIHRYWTPNRRKLH